jgi:hypothetical protein
MLQRTHRLSARDIAQALDGERQPDGSFMCRCPVPGHGKGNGDRNRSLSLCDDADGRVLVHCFAGCPNDTVIDVLRSRGQWPPKSEIKPKLTKEQQREVTRRQACEIWNKATPLAQDAPHPYFLARGIDTRLFPEIGKTLRLALDLFHKKSGTTGPGIVAAVTDNDGVVMGIQRIFLTHDQRSKRPVEDAKMSLGMVKGFAVRLGRQSAVGLIGEGLEDVMTAMIASQMLRGGFACMGGETMMPSLVLPEHTKEVIIVSDGDVPGRKCTFLSDRAFKKQKRSVSAAYPPEGEGIKDFNDLVKGKTGAELEAAYATAAERLENTGDAIEPPPDPKPLVILPPPKSLGEVNATFEKWLMLPNLDPLHIMLGSVVANLLPGDPVSIGTIGAPSTAKTELLNSLSKLPFVRSASKLSPAGLLSGTPKRQKDKNAKGGLLMEIGEFGIIAFKDFTTILSMRSDEKLELIAAIREILDGKWTRNVGADGGRELSWKGKVGIMFACTEAYDDHYGFIGALGDRFLLSRMTRSPDAYDIAIKHTGAATETMRDELADAVLGLFVSIGVIDPVTGGFTRDLKEPPAITADEHRRIKDAASLAVHLRAHVTRNGYNREIENIHAPEGEPRIGLALGRMFTGLLLIGVEREHALNLVMTVAISSTLPVRRRAFEQLNDTPKTTSDIAKAIDLPTNTTRRALEELTAYGLAIRAAKPPKTPKTPNLLGEKTPEKGTTSPDHWHIGPRWKHWPSCLAIMFPAPQKHD